MNGPEYSLCTALNTVAGADQENLSAFIPSPLYLSIQRFFDSVRGYTVAQSLEADNARHIVDNFKQFLYENKCYLALRSLEVLLQEKGPKDPFRKDKITPNFLHEIRNCASILSLIQQGYIPADDYLRHGGLDADLAARLRHDSIEDKGVTHFGIYTDLERHCNACNSSGLISDEEEYTKRIEATIAAENIDLMTRKTSRMDPETGALIQDEKGKIKSFEKYGGDKNIYFQQLLRRPPALLCKYADRTENVATRWGKTGFSTQKQIDYARETREIYGLDSYDESAIEAWPTFSKAIHALDDMLGIQLVIFETVNRYRSDEHLNPQNGSKIRIERYVPRGLEPFQNTPACFHPLSIAVHSLNREAENDTRISNLLSHIIYPSLQLAVKNHKLRPIEGLPDNPTNVVSLRFGQP